MQAIAETGPQLKSHQYVLNKKNQDDWYEDLMHLLITRCNLDHLNRSQRRALKFKTHNCMIKNGNLFHKDHAGVYLRCVSKEESKNILHGLHDKFSTRHGGHLDTAHAVLRAGYYWPTIFKDVYHHIQHCHVCQIHVVSLKF